MVRVRLQRLLYFYDGIEGLAQVDEGLGVKHGGVGILRLGLQVQACLLLGLCPVSGGRKTPCGDEVNRFLTVGARKTWRETRGKSKNSQEPGGGRHATEVKTKL